MARQARAVGMNGYYHVMMRGVNRQTIFYDDEDNERWLNCLRRYSNELRIDICAYSLMGNHVHLLVKAFSGLDRLIKKMGASYVYYFNRKYDRVGHLFQDRFRSEVLDTDERLLAAFRYILQNPFKAGIGGIKDYKWSSWNELDGKTGFCNFEKIIQIAGSLRVLKQFVLADNNDECLENTERRLRSDVNAVKIIQQETGIDNPQNICLLKKSEQKSVFAFLIRAGLSIRQLSRLTGISRHIIKIFSVGTKVTVETSPADNEDLRKAAQESTG